MADDLGRAKINFGRKTRPPSETRFNLNLILA